MSYTQEDVVREKAELATCKHYVEDYEYHEIDWPCGEAQGTCLLCEAAVVCDATNYYNEIEFYGEWRLA